MPDNFDIITKNSDLIMHLRESELNKDELADVSGLSTKTIYRRMKQLVDREYAKKEGHNYFLTNIGKFYADMLINSSRLVRTLENNRQTFSNVDSSSFPIFLLTSSKVIPQNTAFSKTFSELVHENLDEPSAVQAVFGHFSRRHFNALQEMSSLIDTKILLDIEDYSVLETNHRDILDYLHKSALDIETTKINFPHSILKLDDSSVVIELNTDRGDEKALLINSDIAVREWATNKYAYYRDS